MCPVYIRPVISPDDLELPFFRHRYGHQRMFGSLGWGLAMFFVGIALDHSTAFSEHPCGPDAREKNYTICFAIFSVLMGAALITATQINFKYDIPVMEPVSDYIQPEIGIR